MRSRWQRAVVVALSLLSLPLLTACEPRTLQIQLPGYGDGAIDGIWLWRRAPSGAWTRACRIDFTGRRITRQGDEELEYQQMCVNGNAVGGLKFPAPIVRSADAPATITVELVYLRYEASGSYRATAFNEFGESPLSSNSLPL